MDYWHIVNYVIIIWEPGRRGIRLQPEQQDATRKQGSSEDKVNNSPNLVVYCTCINVTFLLLLSFLLLLKSQYFFVVQFVSTM